MKIPLTNKDMQENLYKRFVGDFSEWIQNTKNKLNTSTLDFNENFRILKVSNAFEIVNRKSNEVVSTFDVSQYIDLFTDN